MGLYNTKDEKERLAEFLSENTNKSQKELLADYKNKILNSTPENNIFPFRTYSDERTAEAPEVRDVLEKVAAIESLISDNPAGDGYLDAVARDLSEKYNNYTQEYIPVGTRTHDEFDSSNNTYKQDLSTIIDFLTEQPRLEGVAEHERQNERILNSNERMGLGHLNQLVEDKTFLDKIKSSWEDIKFMAKLGLEKADDIYDKSGIEESLWAIKEMVVPTNRYTLAESDAIADELVPRLWWLVRNTATLGGKLGPKGYDKKLADEASKFRGFGSVTMPTGSKALNSVIEGKIYGTLGKELLDASGIKDVINLDKHPVIKAGLESLSEKIIENTIDINKSPDEKVKDIATGTVTDMLFEGAEIDPIDRDFIKAGILENPLLSNETDHQSSPTRQPIEQSPDIEHRSISEKSLSDFLSGYEVKNSVDDDLIEYKHYIDFLKEKLKEDFNLSDSKAHELARQAIIDKFYKNESENVPEGIPPITDIFKKKPEAFEGRGYGQQADTQIQINDQSYDAYQDILNGYRQDIQTVPDQETTATMLQGNVGPLREVIPEIPNLMPIDPLLSDTPFIDPQWMNFLESLNSYNNKE